MSYTNALSPILSRPERDQIGCGSCTVSQWCLPGGLDDAGTARLDTLITRRRVLRDEQLFCIDEPFHAIYAIRFGHFKTFRDSLNGQRHIVGFHMASDVLGLDAIGPARHASGAVALDTSEVCAIPFLQFEQLSSDLPRLQQIFYRVLGHAITRDQSAMLVMGRMRAERKLAVFLLDLSARYAACGYSPLRFRLRMSREEIGNYLGLTVESVSRVFLRFRQKGLLRTDHREVCITDQAAMEALATGRTPAEPIASRAQAAQLLATGQ